MTKQEVEVFLCEMGDQICGKEIVVTMIQGYSLAQLSPQLPDVENLRCICRFVDEEEIGLQADIKFTLGWEHIQSIQFS